MNYLKNQIMIYLYTIKHSFNIIQAAPWGWLAIWLFITMFMFVSLFALLLPFTGYLFLLNMGLLIGMVSTAHELSHDPEYQYQNRTLDPFFAPWRADNAFTGFALGFVLILAIILWGAFLNRFYPTAQHDGVIWLPNFLFFPSGKILFLGVPLLWIWFAPSYFIHHHESVFKAMMFSISGCLKNGVSLALLFSSFAGLIAMIVSASTIHPIWLLPIWTCFYVLISISSYAHFYVIHVRG